LEFLRARVPTHLRSWRNFAHESRFPNVHLHAKFRLDRFSLSLLSAAVNPLSPNFPLSQLPHLVLAPPSGVDTVERGCIIITHYPTTISKPLLSSNAFCMGKVVLSISAGLERDGQTDKETDRQTKTQHFGCRGGVRIPSPTHWAW